MQGNTAPGYRIPTCLTTPPDWLLAAWRYDLSLDALQDAPFSGSARIRELVRSCMGYMIFLQENYNDQAEAIRAGGAIVGMGLKMISDWPLKDDYVAGKSTMHVLTGMAITAAGYKSLIKLYDTTGDSNAKAAAQAQNETFQAQCAKYRRAFEEEIKMDLDVFGVY